jgi:hypothetical protein
MFFKARYAYKAEKDDELTIVEGNLIRGMFHSCLWWIF